MESTLFKMAEMTEEINLTKPIPEIILCKTCKISTLCLKPHNSHIQSGETFINLIHLNVLGPFKIGFNNSQFIIITFLCDTTQFSVIYCIKSKANIVQHFRNFKQYYEQPDHKIHQL